MTVRIMAEQGQGPGEAAAKAKRRSFWTILGVIFAVGFVTGLMSAFYETPTDGGFLTGTFPPWFAAVAATVTLVALTAGTWIFFRRVDELERQDNLVAAAYGANFVLIAYPVWFMLWKGGWVPEPHHAIVVGALFVVRAATYLIRKFR